MMQMTKIKRSLSFFLCTVLIAATALAVTGCSGKDDAAGGSGSSAAAGSSTAQVSSSAAQPGSSTAQTGGYDKDGVYWAFYVDGEYASTGVDATEVTAGAAYALKLEKA